MAKKDIKDKAINWMEDWSNLKIFKNKNIKEILEYGGISLWWFIHPVLYFNIESIIRKIEKNENLSKEKIDKKIKVLFGPLFLNLKDKIRRKEPKLKKVSHIKNKKILIISSTRYWGEVGALISGKKEKGDILFDAIIKELKNQNFDVVCVDVDYNNKINLNILKEKLEKKWIPFEIYTPKKITLKAKLEIIKLKQIWVQLKKSNLFKDSLKYKEIRLWPLLKLRFEQIFSDSCIYRYIKIIETAENMIDKENPSCILMSFETGYYSLSSILIARERKIPSIGIQHGVISSSSQVYIRNKTTRSLRSLDCPIPDKLAVYGKYTKNLLTKRSHYPNDSVIITGQPRYDSLRKIDKELTRKNFFNKYSLNLNKKTVLITTQALNNFKERDDFLRNVIRSLKQINGIQIIIKPKPDEDVNFHKKILKEEKTVGTIIPKTSNIYEAINSADLIITVYSTTALEAMILKKNVLIINLGGERDQIPYVESGAALGVYKVEKILPTLKRMLNSKRPNKNLSKKRERFVYEQIYKNDGKSTKRVVNLIKSLLSKSNEKS